MSPSATIRSPQQGTSIVNEMILSSSSAPCRQEGRPHSTFPAHTSQSSSLQTENCSDALLEEALKKMLDTVHRKNAALGKERHRLQVHLENLKISSPDRGL